jgi:[ribosomal protein S5]-alanine N-acetyltransferase
MTGYSRPIGHPAGIISSKGPLRLFGRRVMLRPLVATDFEAWSEVRLRNGEWLTKWEPMPLITSPDPAKSRDAFTHRCAARDRERQSGNAYCMGLFVNNVFTGEVNLNSVMRGAMQSGTIGYWIDEAKAGNSYVSEAVLVLMKFAFEELRLHRMEICIVPRNANSRRVVEKLQLREEGIAERFLEINGIWEDHVRYGFTIEEWQDRRDELTAAWL